jgi:protein tyrosine phosphatase (PTP) superfamily phosphohydrolase (DUF442 family)
VRRAAAGETEAKEAGQMKAGKWFCLLLLVLLLGGCSPGGELTGPTPPFASRLHAQGEAKIEAPGLHNVYRINDRLLSGSSPEGDEGFHSLQKLGIRTVISVDGATPDVERARKYGLRYVHLPIGYDGVSERQALRLARAVRDLPGRVYIHCHHGQHRGPAAAAVVHLCLDEKCGVETALAEMRRAGTDPRYTGLYAAPRMIHRPTSEELDRVPGDFPETAEVAALAQVMVGVDETWERLKQVRRAGWKTPRDHPDLDPAHEALQLVEHYREAGRLPQVRERSEEFRRWLSEGESGARELESLLRPPDRKPVTEAVAEKAFQGASAACARCHAKYRDIPQKP